MSRTSDPKRMGLYGSLYLDRGEGMTKVRDQLNTLQAKGMEEGIDPAGLYFDVIFGPKQHGKAERMARDIEDAAHETFTDPKFEDMVIYVCAIKATSGSADPRDAPVSARSTLMQSIERG